MTHTYRRHALLLPLCLASLPLGAAVASGGTPKQAAPTAAPTTSLTLSSPATQVRLVELYTSEGCSSCPPADRWLSQLQQQPGLWRDFVPVALHVDYWDSLGWRDRFAAAAHTSRQERYVRSRRLSQVYTPGVLLGGMEWRGWTSQSDIAPLRDLAGPLQLQQLTDGTVRLTWWSAKPAGQNPTGVVVLLGTGLHSDVRSGENSGRELRHDFVVLSSARVALQRDGDHWQGRLQLPKAAQAAPRYALAGWVSAGDDPLPLQAVGGWLQR